MNLINLVKIYFTRFGLKSTKIDFSLRSTIINVLRIKLKEKFFVDNEAISLFWDWGIISSREFNCKNLFFSE